MNPHRLIVVLALACVAGTVLAQSPVYSPLFSEDMIRNASPTQAARMSEAEAQNRKAFEDRQQARRAQQASTEAQAQAAQQKRQSAAPAATPTRGKSKVFKWVDANGRVHFGDAPQGRNAKEVKVRGAARIQGTPLPPPGQRQKEADED